MEKSTKKKVIIIASLLVIGGVVAYIVIKKPFAKKGEGDSGTGTPPAGEETYGSTDTSVAVTTTPPAATTTDQKAQSFAALKKYFLPKGTTANVDPFEKVLVLNGKTRRVQFYSNGRFFVFVKSADGKQWLLGTQGQKGSYTDGGKSVFVDAGLNKGYGYSSNNPIATLKKSLNL